MASGEMSPSQFRQFLATALGLARDRSRLGSIHYVFMEWRSIGLLLSLGEELYSALLNICVWAKTNAGMGSFYRSQHELIAVFRHGDVSHVNNVQLGRLGRHRSNLWTYAGATAFSRSRTSDLADHPTVKPIALIADAIRDGSKPGDLILDPFGGSGSALLAAHSVGRRAALIEIDPAYVDLALRRFEDRTGSNPHSRRMGSPSMLFVKSVCQRRVLMSQHEDDGDDDAPYQVGYGKPPIAHQFKPGQSGNRKGRPRKSRNLETLIHEALDARVAVTERGQTKRLPISELIAKQLVRSAVNGDHKAIEALLKMQRNRPRPEPLQFDLEIDLDKDDFIERLTAARHLETNDDAEQQDVEERLPDDDAED